MNGRGVYSILLILIGLGAHQRTILQTGFLMDITLSEWRKLLETAGKSIPVQNSRLTTAELLAYCATSNPFALCKFPFFLVSLSHGRSGLVPTGGMVFAGFITLFGSQRLLSKFNKLCRRHEEDPTVVASPAFMDQATRALGPRFHGHMTGLHHSPGLRTQRFFMTFMARYHGLSVLGGDLLSPMGMMMPSSSYDTMLKSVVDIALLKGRYPIDMIERKEKNIVWIWAFLVGAPKHRVGMHAQPININRIGLDTHRKRTQLYVTTDGSSKTNAMSSGWTTSTKCNVHE